MMFGAFKRHFLADSNAAPPIGDVGGVDAPPAVAPLLTEFGGSSFNGGLYRVVRVNDVAPWSSRIGYAFPEFQGRIACFGYDWLGRAFAVDSKRLEGGKPGVLLFEPGTGEALEVPANIETFHDDELVNFGESCLAIEFFHRWRGATHAKLAYDQCAGYKMPLFFGGEDDLDNLEISDIDVYWHIFGQLILKTKGLPVGTPVRVKKG